MKFVVSSNPIHSYQKVEKTVVFLSSHHAAGMEVISSSLSISTTCPRSPAKRHQTAASGLPSTPRRILSISAQQLPTSALKRSLKPSQTPYPAPQQSSTTTATTTSTASPKPPLKKVLVPIGYGTEEMEAVILIDVLRRAGAEVFVASVESQLEIEAAGGTRLVADVSISDCLDQIFDLVALPGGMPGSARLRDCEALKKITSKQAEEKRLYGAICAAPAIALLPWGLLKHKWTTCHPAFFNRLPTFWAVKSNNIVSEELTTSRGPGTAFDFALSFTEQLFGESITKEIREFFLLPTDVVDGALRKEEFNKVEWSVSHTPQVLVPVANGSEEIEVVTVIDVLRRAKADVVVASVEKSVLILASRGTKIVADKSIVSAAKSVYDMIILPGGAIGAGRLHKSKVLKRLLKEQEASGRLYGAICSSPSILHKQGLLKDKKAAAHPSVRRKLTDQVVDGVGVVIDGKVITSRGLSTVTDFALAVVSKLFGPARARCVAEGLVFEYPKN